MYYYDRAGNLIQTVAPEGVKESYTTRVERTDHEFRTQYRFNSLKQLVWQRTPDGGETTFHYDDLGQLRFSQNAQQALDGFYAFAKYDHLGRVIETGKASGISITDDNLNNQNYPTTNTSEKIRTVYTTPFPNPLTNNKQQRFLQNRVSYSFTEDGSYTIYSYDPHGNVEWIVQDILPELQMDDPTIKQFLVEYEYDLISNKVTRLNYQPNKVDQFFTRYSYDEDNRLTAMYTSRDGQIWDQDMSYQYFQHGPLRRQEIGEDKLQGVDYIYTIQGWLKSINHPLLAAQVDPAQDGHDNSRFPPDVFSSYLIYHENDFQREDSYINHWWAHANLPIERNLYNGNISAWITNAKHSSSFPIPTDLKYPFRTARVFQYDELNRLTKSDFQHHSSNWTNTEEYDSDYTYDANGNILTLNRNGYQLTDGSVKMDRVKYYYNSSSFNPKPIDWNGFQM